MQFGTKFRAGWGNQIPNVYYRVRAVSVAGVRGLPSPTLNVKITNTAPSPAAPTLLSPVGGASRSIPLTFDWTDTPNRETPSYDLDIDDDPAFAGAFGVFLIHGLPAPTTCWSTRSHRAPTSGACAPCTARCRAPGRLRARSPSSRVRRSRKALACCLSTPHRRLS